VTDKESKTAHVLGQKNLVRSSGEAFLRDAKLIKHLLLLCVISIDHGMMRTYLEPVRVHADVHRRWCSSGHHRSIDG
jgi:hypothetical protein